MDKTVEAVGGLPAGVRSGRGAAGTKLVLFLALLPVACVAGADPPAAGPAASGAAAVAADRLVASLGPREVILPSGRYGLKYCPDECLAFLQSGPPVRLLMAAGVSTFLLEGPDMRSLVPRGPVLRPGKPGSFDNGYAGISGTAGDPASGALFGFYHAEDHEAMPPIPGGIAGFYCCIAAAVSRDGGASFEKLGPVITSSRPKDVQGRADQGCGDLCAVATPDHRDLYVYYSDHSHVDNRGVQICLARCPLEELGRTDRWRKYYRGAFAEPALGGMETPVVSAAALRGDALFPQVTFVRELRRYVMVFNVHVYREYRQEALPVQSGIYIACSEDGLRWSKPTQLIAIRSIAVVGREVGWHPTLLLSTIAHGSAKGWLFYAYSESWGHRAPRAPHYLAGQPIAFSLAGESRDR